MIILVIPKKHLAFFPIKRQIFKSNIHDDKNEARKKVRYSFYECGVI